MLKTLIGLISVWLIPAIILVVLVWGLVKKVPVYETFIEGAKDGVKVSFNIVPYLVAIIVAISMLRASGIIDCCADITKLHHFLILLIFSN